MNDLWIMERTRFSGSPTYACWDISSMYYLRVLQLMFHIQGRDDKNEWKVDHKLQKTGLVKERKRIGKRRCMFWSTLLHRKLWEKLLMYLFKLLCVQISEFFFGEYMWNQFVSWYIIHFILTNSQVIHLNTPYSLCCCLLLFQLSFLHFNHLSLSTLHYTHLLNDRQLLFHTHCLVP